MLTQFWMPQSHLVGADRLVEIPWCERYQFESGQEVVTLYRNMSTSTLSIGKTRAIEDR